jgi:hypothetical protein
LPRINRANTNVHDLKLLTKQTTAVDPAAGRISKEQMQKMSDQLMAQVDKKLSEFLTRAAVNAEFEDMREKCLNASAICSVLNYKVDLQMQMQAMSTVDRESEALQDETNKLVL